MVGVLPAQVSTRQLACLFPMISLKAKSGLWGWMAAWTSALYLTWKHSDKDIKLHFNDNIRWWALWWWASVSGWDVDWVKGLVPAGANLRLLCKQDWSTSWLASAGTTFKQPDLFYSASQFPNGKTTGWAFADDWNPENQSSTIVKEMNTPPSDSFANQNTSSHLP